MRARGTVLLRLFLCLVGLLPACGRDDAGLGRVVPVERQDLVVAVAVTGTLKSLESEQIGPPATAADMWDFKIIRMVPEGALVKAGSEVIAFDPSELERKLQDQQSEVQSASEELGKLRSEQDLTSLTDRLGLADAEAKQRKSELKADKPADLTAAVMARAAVIDRDLAQREVRFRRERDQASRRQGQANLEILLTRLNRARSRVAEIKAAIDAMSVKAGRKGTVVYEQNWRGEKKKVGDGTWRGESVLEIAALDRMAAQGQVDEVDASQVAVGQRVGLRLEAHPDKEYAGVVRRVASLVQTESPESRVKVVLLDIELSETDPLLMRPAMRLRGRIEIARVPGVLQVPLAAIECTAAGPTVTLVPARGLPRTVPVKLGRRGQEAVEVTGGLSPGDQVRLPAPGGAAKGGLRLGAS